MSAFFTGVGSRNTPEPMLTWEQEVAKRLESMGYALRSGGAVGSDQAFQSGIVNPENMEIYLPWPGFNDLQAHQPGFYMPKEFNNYYYAVQIAAEVHPAWERLTGGARILHTRNVYQVLGQDLKSPSRLLLCWAPPSRQNHVKGGTNTAVQLARRHHVPVINLFGASSFNVIWERIVSII